MLFRQTSKRSRTLSLAAAAMLVGSLAYAGIAHADENDGGGAAGPITNCDGGVQKQVRMRTNTSPLTRGEGALAPIGWTFLNTANADNDLYVVTFSSETELGGPGPNDSVEIQARLDGQPMNPIGPNTFVESVNHTVQNSAMWCARVPAGAHTVQVFWGVTDSLNNNVVSARLDDAALHVAISD